MRLSGLVPAARKSRLAKFLVAAIGLAIASRSDAAVLSPAPPESIRLVEALQAQGNLEKIMLALHNYNDAFGCLPPAYVADSGGRPFLCGVQIGPGRRQLPGKSFGRK